ncbi:glutaredoxin family protein [Cytobacillus gottheilii]|uniref:glutaredoxin family protein n=1 Tax=Cytobacillus gottheilii TaxID=859144 RepID=UPI0009BB0F83|nr:glutaredoxin family protein [Cytobacillus gottheilii]
MSRKLTLYTRNKCPLCDKAKQIILELKDELTFQYTEYDIDESDELTERYGLMIPVVYVDGVEVQYGQIDRMTLEEALV